METGDKLPEKLSTIHPQLTNTLFDELRNNVIKK